MNEDHQETQQTMQRVNALAVKNSWSHQELANEINKFLNPSLQFSNNLTPKERVSLNRWRAICDEHWAKPSGDYLIAFQKLLDRYA